MKTFNWPFKFNDEVLDYEVDWTGALEGDDVVQGEPVVSVTPGVTVVTQATVDGVTRLRLADGTAGEAVIDLLATATSGQKIGARVLLPVRGR